MGTSLSRVHARRTCSAIFVRISTDIHKGTFVPNKSKSHLRAPNSLARHADQRFSHTIFDSFIGPGLYPNKVLDPTYHCTHPYHQHLHQSILRAAKHTRIRNTRKGFCQ